MNTQSLIAQNPIISRPQFRPAPGRDYYTETAKGPILDKVYSMRYRSYSGAGHIDPCSSGKFMDEYDDRKNCPSFLLYNTPKKAIGSIRVCGYDAEKGYTVPAMEMFGDEIGRAIGYDKRFVETNRFVVDPDFQKRGGLHARFSLFERVVDTAMDVGAENIIIAVRPEHVKFYRRLFLKPISEAKVYHHVKFKTVLLATSEIERAKDFICSKLYGIKNEPTLNYGVN